MRISVDLPLRFNFNSDNILSSNIFLYLNYLISHDVHTTYVKLCEIKIKYSNQALSKCNFIYKKQLKLSKILSDVKCIINGRTTLRGIAMFTIFVRTNNILS